MTTHLEVVYEDGVLRPLQPLPFADKQHLVVTVTDELASAAAFNTRERELDWLRVNRSRHAGKWVAIEGDQLISEGLDATFVLMQARVQGVQHPLLVHIPKEPQLPFGGW